MNSNRDAEGKDRETNAGPAAGSTRRDPGDREVSKEHEREVKDKMMDKTLADSYPASDPPSSIPDPSEHDPRHPEGKEDKAA